MTNKKIAEYLTMSNRSPNSDLNGKSISRRESTTALGNFVIEIDAIGNKIAKNSAALQSQTSALAGQGFFKSLWGGVTGANTKRRDEIQLLMSKNQEHMFQLVTLNAASVAPIQEILSDHIDDIAAIKKSVERKSTEIREIHDKVAKLSFTSQTSDLNEMRKLQSEIYENLQEAVALLNMASSQLGENLQEQSTMRADLREFKNYFEMTVRDYKKNLHWLETRLKIQNDSFDAEKSNVWSRLSPLVAQVKGLINEVGTFPEIYAKRKRQ